jgi:hypothetical protein
MAAAERLRIDARTRPARRRSGAVPLDKAAGITGPEKRGTNRLIPRSVGNPPRTEDDAVFLARATENRRFSSSDP